MAFAVYFDEIASINTEGTPSEGIPIESWLSPLVHEPRDLSHLHNLDNKTWGFGITWELL